MEYMESKMQDLLEASMHWDREANKLNGYDIDGVLIKGIIPEGRYIIISGRTFDEYDATVKALAQFAPVYIRGKGRYGDAPAAGSWKASIINFMVVDEFWEDDPIQFDIIKNNCPNCKVNLVKHSQGNQ